METDEVQLRGDNDEASTANQTGDHHSFRGKRSRHHPRRQGYTTHQRDSRELSVVVVVGGRKVHDYPKTSQLWRSFRTAEAIRHQSGRR